MIINKHIIAAIFYLFGYLNALSQVNKKSISFYVYRNRCIIELRFINNSKQSVKIPDYVLLSTDTFNGYKVLPSEFIIIKEDTLIIKTNHIKRGTLNDFKEEGLLISDQKDSEKINITLVTNVLKVKKSNIQIIRLPTPFCSMNFKYCKLKINGESLLESKVKD